MATTGQNFVLLTAAQLVGTTVQAAGSVAGFNPDNANEIVAGGAGVFVDKPDSKPGGLAAAGYAKNAAAALTLTGTTAITLDLTALAAATGVVVAGDSSFATTNWFRFYNNGTQDLTLSPGASNPATIGFGGTTPTLKIPAGGEVKITCPAGNTVDSTHKTLTITPTAGGSLLVAVGGA